MFREIDNSGFPSKRINLSPFTKDFRGGEQLNESFVISYRPTLVGHTIQSFLSFEKKNPNEQGKQRVAEQVNCIKTLHVHNQAMSSCYRNIKTFFNSN